MTQKSPTKIDIDSSSDFDYLYKGLAKQNIEFHHAIAELIDNAISAKKEQFFRVEILLKKNGDSVEVTVADDGKGINEEDIKSRVLRLGSRV